MAALAHQFAGLISPLHGQFSADNWQAKPAICLINEVSPVMLTGPNGPFPAQFEPPRSNRAIADSWRGLYGSDLFPSMLRRAAFEVLRNGTIRTNILMFCQPQVD